MNEMDTQLRDLLEAAVGEPPHQVTIEAVRRRVVRRRVTEGIAAAVAVVLIAVTVPFGIGAVGRGPGPSAAGSASTVYVLGDGVLTPISSATDIPGKPIPVAQSESESMTMTPDGKTIYVTGRNSVTPVSRVTNTAGKPIPLGDDDPGQILFTPGGKTAYVLSIGGVTPIATGTNTPGKFVGIENIQESLTSMAITPDGRTLYVVAGTPNQSGALLIPISTATNTPGTPIQIDMSIPFSVTMSPDGKTAYVVGMTNGSHGSQTTVIPVATATNTPGQPLVNSDSISGDTFGPYGKTLYFSNGNHLDGVIPFDLNTGTFGKLISFSTGTFITATPDNSTIYVDTGTNYGNCPNPDQVTPISTATRVPERPIQIPCGSGGYGAITRDGKTLWIGGGDTVTPITTATNTAGSPIKVKVGSSLLIWGGDHHHQQTRIGGKIYAMLVTP